MVDLFDAYNFLQHVTGSTYVDCYVLDLVLSWTYDVSVMSKIVSCLVVDHH